MLLEAVVFIDEKEIFCNIVRNASIFLYTSVTDLYNMLLFFFFSVQFQPLKIQFISVFKLVSHEH